MSVRRGTANISSERARNVEALANVTALNLQLINNENFLEYFEALTDQLSRLAVQGGEPFLGHLARMASLGAKNRRDEIHARWAKSAA